MYTFIINFTATGSKPSASFVASQLILSGDGPVCVTVASASGGAIPATAPAQIALSPTATTATTAASGTATAPDFNLASNSFRSSSKSISYSIISAPAYFPADFFITQTRGRIGHTQASPSTDARGTASFTISGRSGTADF